MTRSRLGTVFLVGAGPGDPGLLTVRAKELIESCDCVVYDYLVNPAIVAMAPESAERRFVGKRGRQESASQADINQILLDMTKAHSRVVRLKGGDPFLFGRGGEEAQTLAEHGVSFEIVPGVTSGIAVPAYAGIPVTHRAASSAVAFCTGHEQADKDAKLDWAALAKVETLILYMGMHKLDEICAGLIEHGKSADTPACVIQWGTLPQQRVATGTLATLAQVAKEAGLGAPAITVIGEVVKYRDKIRWFDSRPLFNKTVLVTRSREQASDLSKRLTLAGARVIEYPLNKQEPPESWKPLDDEIARLLQYNWLIFSSANGVNFFWQRLRAKGHDARSLAGLRIAAVGPATAETLRHYGLSPDVIPEIFSAEALATAILAVNSRVHQDQEKIRALLPQADNANPNLRSKLVEAGANVTTVVAYRNMPVHLDIDLSQLHIDAATFASSATVERFVMSGGKKLLDKLIAEGCRFYAIGPETAAAMRVLGMPCAAVADQATIPALVEQVEKDFALKANTKSS